MREKGKILVIEDDPSVARTMAQALKRAGCEVVVAYTGKEGLQLAREHRFDLITLDVDLPDISGFEICRELKQRHLSRHTPIIFVSGRLNEDDQRRSREVGAMGFLTKPFNAPDFVSRILSRIQANESCDFIQLFP